MSGGSLRLTDTDEGPSRRDIAKFNPHSRGCDECGKQTFHDTGRCP